jgi:hypothetical protein
MLMICNKTSTWERLKKILKTKNFWHAVGFYHFKQSDHKISNQQTDTKWQRLSEE